jgi:hypothetical protein
MANPAVILAEGGMTPVIASTKTGLGLALNGAPVIFFNFNANFRRCPIEHRLLAVFDHLMVAHH